jgi:hypothetical protein
MTAMRRTAAIHGAFYVLTGLWPILHIRSFEVVTGPKRERWLVKTLGALIAAVGASLLRASHYGDASGTARWLGLGSALALGTADVRYAASGRIAPVYFADAVVEAALAAAWLSTARASQRA